MQATLAITHKAHYDKYLLMIFLHCTITANDAICLHAIHSNCSTVCPLQMPFGVR